MHGLTWSRLMQHSRKQSISIKKQWSLRWRQNGRDGVSTLHWRHNDHDSVSNHQPHGRLLNRLFRRRSKKTSKLRIIGLCVGNSPGPVTSSWSHQPHDCFLKHLFMRRSKKTSKLCVTGLCEGNSLVAGKASKAENVSIWWRHHDAFPFHKSCDALSAFIASHISR